MDGLDGEGSNISLAPPLDGSGFGGARRADRPQQRFVVLERGLQRRRPTMRRPAESTIVHRRRHKSLWRARQAHETFFPPASRIIHAMAGRTVAK